MAHAFRGDLRSKKEEDLRLHPRAGPLGQWSGEVPEPGMEQETLGGILRVEAAPSVLLTLWESISPGDTQDQQRNPAPGPGVREGRCLPG